MVSRTFSTSTADIHRGRSYILSVTATRSVPLRQGEILSSTSTSSNSSVAGLHTFLMAFKGVISLIFSDESLDNVFAQMEQLIYFFSSPGLDRDLHYALHLCLLS